MDEKEFRERLIAALPEIPGEAVTNMASNDECIKKELGVPLLIFSRESVPDEYDVDWCYNGSVPKLKYHWGARCLCTECGEKFTEGYAKDGIIIRMGEDGCAYTGLVEEGETDAYKFRENEQVRCPLCDTVLKVTRKSSIRNGRTFRTQIAELVNADGIGCIVYWIAQRFLDSSGYSKTEFIPRGAIAVTPNGSMRRFSKTKKYMTSESYLQNWEQRSTMKDPEILEYLSEGLRKIGAYCAEPKKRIMDGTTAEKTGLEEYFGRRMPVNYLKLWRLHPNVENLVRTGWADFTESIILKCTSNYGYYGSTSVDFKKEKTVNWEERKPHRMLGLKKEEYRDLAGRWTISCLEAFKEYESAWPGTDPREVDKWMEELGGAEAFKRTSPCWDNDMAKVMAYVRKQKDKCGFRNLKDTMDIYIDYLRMKAEVNMAADIGEMTPAEEFPTNLRNAHDRQLRIRRSMETDIDAKRKDSKWGERFAAMHETMKELEWTDGNICVVIPGKPSDLVKEGHVLNHCVGGYSESHVSGKPIFFIRHYRRPERSWFTLNENLKGEKPERIQLHGYGNEYAHGKRLTIPKEVITFVNRWEREVLAPWYQKN